MCVYIYIHIQLFIAFFVLGIWILSSDSDYLDLLRHARVPRKIISHFVGSALIK